MWRFSQGAKYWPQQLESREGLDRVAEDYSQLRKCMEELKFHDNELFFHGKELETRALMEETPWLRRWLYNLYGYCSNYGQSILRPAFGLFCISFLFFYAYFFFFMGIENDMARSFYAAINNSFPFLPEDRQVRNALLNLDEICSSNNSNKLICINQFNVLRSVQTILAFLLWFLIGLAIRNRLRMR